MWLEQNGEQAEAIRHALAAADFERAADLVELAIPAMRRSRQEAAVHHWLELLPDEVVRVRPVLRVGFAGALLSRGEFDGVEGRLQDVQQWLDAPSGKMVVVDDEEFRRLPAMIELYRAALALAQGDGLGTVRHARRVLDLAPGDEHLVRAGAAGMLGLAFWRPGAVFGRAGHTVAASVPDPADRGDAGTDLRRLARQMTGRSWLVFRPSEPHTDGRMCDEIMIDG